MESEEIKGMRSSPKKKQDWLVKYIFCGFKDMNTGFDIGGVQFYTEEQFRVIMKRIEEYGCGICGIEPWCNGEYWDTKVPFKKEYSDSTWYLPVFEELVKLGLDLVYSATYDVPDGLLKVEDFNLEEKRKSEIESAEKFAKEVEIFNALCILSPDSSRDKVMRALGVTLKLLDIKTWIAD